MEDIIKKVISTINSCKTQEQLIASQRFMFLYLKKFKKPIEYDNKYNELIKFFNIKRSEIIINDKK